MSNCYRVALVGQSGQKEFIKQLHGDVYQSDVYKLGKRDVLYTTVNLAPNVQTSYTRQRMDAIVFTVDVDTDARDVFLYEVASLKSAEFDLARVVVYGPARASHRVATDLRLGHHVSDSNLMEETLLAILKDTRPRDTITLGQSEEGARRTRGC